MSRSRTRTEHPLMAALAAADAAIHADAPPEARVAAALSILADGLATMLASSDASETRSGSRLNTVAGTNQSLRRHGRFQDDRVAEIRKASRDAESSRRDELPALYAQARASTNAALRSQVKKLRIDRRTRQDGPGGEG